VCVCVCVCVRVCVCAWLLSFLHAQMPHDTPGIALPAGRAGRAPCFLGRAE
jgi:hypothetical protein